MKRCIVLILIAALLLAGCTTTPAVVTEPTSEPQTAVETESVTTEPQTATEQPETPVTEPATQPATQETTGGKTEVTKATTKVTTAKTTQKTTVATTAADTEGYTIKSVITDSAFYNGFTVLSQKDHAHGDAVTRLGEFCCTNSFDDPTWEICQWDSGPCLWNDRVSSDANTLTDGVSKWVTYDKKEKILGLRINTDAYYQGKGAKSGDYWPHLLTQESLTDYARVKSDKKVFYTGGADKLMLSMDLRLSKYEETYNEDDWVEAAQLYMYFYLRFPDNTHFVWFGIQLFDSRWEFTEDSLNIDGGKADASGLPIYLIGMWNAYQYDDTFWKDGKPVAGKDWRHIEVDLVPHIQKLVQRGIATGYFPAGTTAADLHFDGMNYGWEVIGTYDVEMDIKNLNLDSWVKDAE